jgi:hypothetical protein
MNSKDNALCKVAKKAFVKRISNRSAEDTFIPLFHPLCYAFWYTRPQGLFLDVSFYVKLSEIIHDFQRSVGDVQLWRLHETRHGVAISVRSRRLASWETINQLTSWIKYLKLFTEQSSEGWRQEKCPRKWNILSCLHNTSFLLGRDTRFRLILYVHLGFLKQQ